MKKLEQYLDQVCGGIGGPRALRQHVRRELREHLVDAVARHAAAGLSEEEAIERALAEFGRPEEVRSELEATHGQQRLLAVVLEKAVQWQEKTMRAKWLWASWAYLALILVVALEILFLTFTNLMIVPKFEQLVRHGFVDAAVLEEQDLSWLRNGLANLRDLTGNHTTLLVLLAVVVIALFEWRVRSEHKPFMRVAALGTVAVVLMGVIAFMTGSMLVAFELGAPRVFRMTRPWAVEQVERASKSLGALDRALTSKDWPEVDRQTEAAAGSLRLLSQGPAIASLTRWNEAPSIEELRAQVQRAQDELRAVQQAGAARDASRAETAALRLHDAWLPIQTAATRIVE